MIYVKKENNVINAYSFQVENSIEITEEEWEQSQCGINCDIIDNQFVIIEKGLD